MNKQTEPEHGKPVIIYILLLFTTALLLMGLSSLIHQRNNSEALGRLQSDLTNIQSIQEAQEKIISLQEERKTMQDAQDALEDQLAESQDALQRQETEAAARQKKDQAALDALNTLYLLEQAFRLEQYDLCRTIIQENASLVLSDEAPREGVPSPAARWAELCEAVAALPAD